MNKRAVAYLEEHLDELRDRFPYNDETVTSVLDVLDRKWEGIGWHNSELALGIAIGMEIQREMSKRTKGKGGIMQVTTCDECENDARGIVGTRPKCELHGGKMPEGMKVEDETR